MRNEQRIVELSHGPVLGTLDGARARVAHLGLADLMLLLTWYDCDLDHLHRHLWLAARLRSHSHHRV